jgi:hypothetical protein
MTTSHLHDCGWLFLGEPMSKKDAKFQWAYIGHSFGSEPFDIDGIDVWKRDWIRTEDPPVDVKDPLYKSMFQL